jgi:hypothetical protein
MVMMIGFYGFIGPRFLTNMREDCIGAEAVQTFPAKSPFYANPNPMKIYLGFSLRFEPRDTLPHGGNSIVVTCIQKGMSIKQEGSTV